MNLPYSLTPEYAPFYAQAAAETAKESGIDLDYSPESLEKVDKIIEMLRASSGGFSPDVISSFVLGLGCYIGQVLVMHAAGMWKKSNETPLGEALAGWPIVIELAGDNGVCNPIEKAFKRLINGAEDSVVPFGMFFILLTRQRKGKLDWEHQTSDDGTLEFYIATRVSWKAVVVSSSTGSCAYLQCGSLKHWQEKGITLFPDITSAQEWCESEIAKVESAG